MRGRRITMAILWLFFFLYAWLIAPSGNEGFLQQLITMDDPDPLLLTVFSLLGVYPIAFAILLLSHDDSRVPAWPFVIGSFLFGAFALIPYFFLSSTKSNRSLRTPDALAKFLQSTVLHMVLLIGTLFLMMYGITQGDLALYREAFSVSRFVHVMTVDFIVLTGLSVYVIWWDRWKRGLLKNGSWLGFIPLVGVLIYIVRLNWKKGV